MNSELQIALITDDAFRAESVEAVTSSLHWHLFAGVGEAQPLNWLRRTQVNLVLVDLDMPNGIGLLREIAATLPHVTLLALVTSEHLVELQEALMAGASSFVAFPVEPQQFMSTIVRVAQEAATRAAQPKSGRLVAVAGLKGGVGRTTLAVNVAVALRQRVNQDVVLVEAHHGLSDLSLMLNLLPRHTIASLAQENNIDADVLQGHLHTHVSRVKVLTAPPDLEQLVELPVETWRLILTQLTELMPYVIVDTAGVADAVLSEVLTMADDILVVTGPDLAGLRSAAVLLQSLESEEDVHARTHVVINRAGVRGGVSESACAKQMGTPIAAAIPDDVALATFALNRGVPYVLSHPRSIVSGILQELVTSVFQLQGTPSAGLLSGFKMMRMPQRSRTVQQAIAGD